MLYVISMIENPGSDSLPPFSADDITDEDYAQLRADVASPNVAPEFRVEIPPVTLTRLDTPQHHLVGEFTEARQTTVEELQRGDPETLGRNFGDSAVILQTSNEGLIKIDPDSTITQAVRDTDGSWRIQHIGKYFPPTVEDHTIVSLGEELVLPVDAPKNLPRSLFAFLTPTFKTEPEDQAFGKIERILVVSQKRQASDQIPVNSHLPQDLPKAFFIPQQTVLAQRQLPHTPSSKAA